MPDGEQGGGKMTVSPMVLAVHVGLLLWTTRVIHSRRGDRRAPTRDEVNAVRISLVMAFVTLAVAAVFDASDGGKKLAVVRGLWDVGITTCCLTYGLAIRILRGGRRA